MLDIVRKIESMQAERHPVRKLSKVGRHWELPSREEMESWLNRHSMTDLAPLLGVTPTAVYRFRDRLGL